MNPHKSDRSDPAVLHTETAHPEHTAGYGDGSYKNRAHTYLTSQGLRSFQGLRMFRKPTHTKECRCRQWHSIIQLEYLLLLPILYFFPSTLTIHQQVGLQSESFSCKQKQRPGKSLQLNKTRTAHTSR